MFSDWWGKILSYFQLETASIEAFGGFVTRETFLGRLVLTRSQVFSLMVGRDRMQQERFVEQCFWTQLFGSL